MTLDDYLNSAESMSGQDFAVQVGISKTYMSLVRRGHQRPSYKLAVKISKATGGKVGVLELLEGAG